MYSIEDATFEEFKKLCDNSFENSVMTKDCYDGYLFNKFMFNEEPLIIGGMIEVRDLNTEEDELYMCFAISKDIIKHKRAVLIAGKDYFDFLSQQMPLRIIVEQNNIIFDKFARHFGFKQTNFIEKNEESGIIYNVYIRRQV